MSRLNFEENNKMMWQAITRLLSMGIPMASARFLQTATVFVIMVVLAQMGHEVLAASLLIGFIRIVAMLIFMSPLFALGSIVGRQVGEKNFSVIPAIFQQTLILALLLSIPPMLILFFIQPILVLFHQPAHLIPIVGQYYYFAAFQLPLVLIGTVCAQILAGLKKQHILMLMSVVSFLICSFLVIGFGLGDFGFPKMGVLGVGLASLLSSCLYCLVMLFLLIKYVKPFGPLCRWYLKGMQWFKLALKVGLPILVQVGSQMLSLQLVIFMIGWLGLIAMAASQVSNQYMLFAIVPIFGLAEASAITVGHAYGEKSFKQIHRLGMAGVFLALGFTVLIGIVFAIFHKPLASLFIHFGSAHSAEIYQLMLWLLAIRVISMLFDGTADMLCGALRGLYDTKFPMLVGVVTNWILMIPLAALFAFGFHWGVIGIAIGGTTARILSVGVLVARWRYQMRVLEKP